MRFRAVNLTLVGVGFIALLYFFFEEREQQESESGRDRPVASASPLEPHAAALVEDDQAPHRQSVLPLDNGEQTEKQSLSQGSPTAPVLAGVIQDGEDALVPHAEVRLRQAEHREIDGSLKRRPDRRVRADSFGRFRISGTSGPFTVSASAPGLIPTTRRTGYLAPGDVVEDIVLQVGPARKVSGRVIDQAGTPVGRAEISYRPELYPGWHRVTEDSTVLTTGPDGFVVHSEPDGSFELPDLTTTQYPVQVSHQSYVDQEIRIASRDDFVEIVLRSPDLLFGVVLSRSGPPLPGATVRLFHGGENLLTETTDSEGRFQFPGLPAGTEAILVAVAPGFAAALLPAFRIAPASSPVEVVLDPEEFVAGIVVDQDGAPIPGARVSIYGEQETIRLNDLEYEPMYLEHLLGIHSQTTGQEGKFRFGHLSAGGYELTVALKENPYFHELRVQTEAGVTDLRLVVETAWDELVTIEGMITDALSGELIEEASAVCGRHVGPGYTGGPRLVVSGGRFTRTGMRPGAWSVRVRAKGYMHYYREPEMLQSGTHKIEAKLYPKRSLTVRILDVEGDPVEGAEVSVVDRSGRLTESKRTGGGDPGDRLHPVTDARGMLTFEPVPADVLTVGVRMRNRREPINFEVDLAVPRTEAVDLVLPDAEGQ